MNRRALLAGLLGTAFAPPIKLPAAAAPLNWVPWDYDPFLELVAAQNAAFPPNRLVIHQALYDVMVRDGWDTSHVEVAPLLVTGSSTLP
jgi:hypothetical protein